MFVDQFWKILFLALVATGCWFWWKASAKNKVYKVEVASLAEIIDTRPEAAPKTDEEAAGRVYKALALLHSIASRKGEKFELRTALDDASEINGSSPYLADIVADVMEANYKNASAFGLLDDDDAIWRMEQGSAPKITRGAWEGEPAEVGYHIPPGFNASLATHLANRVLIPQSVKLAMRSSGMTKAIDDWAERMKKVEALTLGDRDEIKREYNALRKASR